MLAGGGEDGTQGGERLGTGVGAEAAGDFLADFHHAQVPFRLIVGEGHGGIVEEPQRIVFVVAQTDQQIVPRPATGSASALTPEAVSGGWLSWNANPCARMRS